jgi:hypothetical protein
MDLPESVAGFRISVYFKRKNTMRTVHQTPITLQANQEHSGVRFVVILVLAAAYIGLFIGLNLIIGSLNSGIAEFAVFLSCTIALPASLGLAALTERMLKRSWPSGQQVVVSAEGLAAYQPLGW